MTTQPISILLAEDDEDDRLFFEDALHDLMLPTHLTTVQNGAELMQLLLQNAEPIHVLYLDINMPLKNGFDCLIEIKRTATLASLPIIIFSTCFDKEVIDQLHTQGANYFMRKPSSFLRLREIIERSLTLMTTQGLAQPSKDKFVLNVL